MKKHWLSIAGLICFTLLLSACSKDSDGVGGDAPEGENGYPSALQGTIYYDWATEGILKMSLPDGVGGSFIPDNSKLNNFDVSRDGKWKLSVVDAGSIGDYSIRFTISDMNDGSVAEEFIYKGPGLSRSCRGYLSPDNRFILITSYEKEDGITIVKRNGELVARLLDINGETIDFNDTKLWLPNNALLITHGKYIIQIPPPYTSGKLLKEMDFEDWDELTVNQAGTQLALQISNHIYTMDMNGANLKQVTTSNFKESMPAFSPDGKHLLIGSDYKQTGPFGYIWYMKIIPNDGKQYNVDPIEPNSPGVIPVFWKGKDKMETAGGQMIWR